MQHPCDLTGRVAVVTGGNGGIGLGMAQGIASLRRVSVVGRRSQCRRRRKPPLCEPHCTDMGTAGTASSPPT